MVKVAIVEDSRKDSDILCEYLKRYGTEKGKQFSIDTFSNGENFLNTFNKEYDILLLDIELPGKDGLTVAKEVRTVDEGVIIAFITNLAQYAIEGYNVDASAYILKPYIYDDFSMKLTRMLRFVKKNTEKIINIKWKNTVLNVNASDIYYVEVLGHYCTYHTAGGNYEIRESMGNIEKELEGLDFYRINNAYLVNMKYISKIEKDDIYIKNDVLKISRNKKHAFLLAFSAYGGR